jgi:hypothetical protein
VKEVGHELVDTWSEPYILCTKRGGSSVGNEVFTHHNGDAVYEVKEGLSIGIIGRHEGIYTLPRQTTTSGHGCMAFTDKGLQITPVSQKVVEVPGCDFRRELIALRPL